MRCQYCESAQTAISARCENCGAPFSAESVAAMRRLEALSVPQKTRRKMPGWVIALMILFFSPFLFPLAIMMLVMLFMIGTSFWFMPGILAAGVFYLRATSPETLPAFLRPAPAVD